MKRRPIYCLEMERLRLFGGCTLVTLFSKSGRNYTQCVSDSALALRHCSAETVLDAVVASLVVRLETSPDKAPAERASKRRPPKLACAVLQDGKNSGQG